ncbi:MAG: hypothetical protein V3S70_00750 [Gammaproteobacteria bacterium]
MVAPVVSSRRQEASPTAGCLIRGALKPEFDPVLTAAAMEFLTDLHRRFAPAINDLLNQRAFRQTCFDADAAPGFSPATRSIRDGDWHLPERNGPACEGRIELKGPALPEVVAAVSVSDADAFVADFEDSLVPTWDNLMAGQVAMRALAHESKPRGGCNGSAARAPIQAIVRPRGWHLFERHILVDGDPVPAALVDFGLYFFHNAEKLTESGAAVWFCLPKLECHSEARLWAEIFSYSEYQLGLSRGTIRATVLIETVPAAFEMHEILYALQDYAVALSVGHWDYILSLIKTWRTRSPCVLPDRSLITPDRHCLQALTRLLRDTCRQRGALAMLRTPEPKSAVTDSRSANIADAGRYLSRRINHAWPLPDNGGSAVRFPSVGSRELLLVPGGRVSEEGIAANVSLCIRFGAAWLSGQSLVEAEGEVADAALADMARAQLWQWIHHPKGVVCDGRNITAILVDTLIEHELKRLLGLHVPDGPSIIDYESSAALLRQLIHQDTLAGHFTVVAYDALD